MNKILGSSLMMTAVLLITSCDKTQSYADMLKAEEKAIERLMDEENIVVLKEYPADGVFKENEFYQMDNDVYINVIDSGNGNRIGTKRQNVNSRFVVRFFKSDTLELDGFASSRLPVTFSYQKYTEDYYIWGYDQNDTNVDAVMSSFICEGLASGLQHVGDSAVVKLIVPFKVRPSSFQSSGEPLYFPKVRYTFEQ